MQALALRSSRSAGAQRRQAQRPVLVPLPGVPRSGDALSDDIPLARRAVLPLKRRSWKGRLAIGAIAGITASLAVAIVFPALLNRDGLSPAIGRLGVKPDRDGRLLGHFPYAEIDRGQLTSVAPGLQLQREAAEALQAMQEAARADGVALVVLSAFRSHDLQEKLFFDVKSDRNQSARERAQVSAPPGYSEHSTGYAVDLGDGSSPATNLSASFEQTAAFDWLQRHAARFHFVLSFPRGNVQGVSYEPWHWRFEGSAPALRVFEPAQRLAR